MTPASNTPRSPDACAECGRIHCTNCSELYAQFGTFVRIHRYWEANDGTSHIIAVGEGKPRVLCSSDLFDIAERVGRVPVQYGLAVS